MTHIPFNPRDENQTPLPHGMKAVIITASSFLLMLAIMIGLLRLATSRDVTYTGIESEAAYERGLFGLLSFSRNQKPEETYTRQATREKTTKPPQSVLTRLSNLEDRLRSSSYEDVSGDMPDVHLTIDF